MKKQVSNQKNETLTLSTFLNVITDLKQTLTSKKDLEEALRDYPTKEDVKLIIKGELTGYPTKEDLKEALKSYATKEDIQDLGNSIMNALDVTDADNKSNKKVLLNHEGRITILETA